jgi:surfactin synthase thioesterase subunit
MKASETTGPRRAGPVRLFCFHHAGGGATAFAGWRSALGRDVEVVPVVLPDRGPGRRPAGPGELTTLVDELAERLAPQLAGPHVFYGHSMGALVAYLLARARHALGQPPPRRLIVAAFAAPHLATAPRADGTPASTGQAAGAAGAPGSAPLGHVWQRGDRDLLAWLSSLSGVPPELLDGREHRSRLLGRLREHLRLCASYQQPAPVALPCPIDVFAGLADPLVPLEHAAAWRDYSTAGCTVHEMRGGHFFPRESKRIFFPELRRALAA